MSLLVFDNTWPGLLSAIFDVYQYRFTEPQIVAQPFAQELLFSGTHTVLTDLAKAKRVQKKLHQILQPKGISALLGAFLSEHKEATQHIYEVAAQAFSTQENVLLNWNNAHALFIQQQYKKVRREKHRMEAFVRFQKSKDGLFSSVVEPDFNVLPLIIPHFKNRYADQPWLIYDAKRKYGIHYDLKTVSEVTLNFYPISQKALSTQVYDEQELLYQQLWKKYFHATGIAARENPKLHIQHMPRRYWKHLIEKQPDNF